MSEIFDYAVPGQSLTSTPGAKPFERPPQYVNEMDALIFLWDKLLKPEPVGRLVVLLKNNITVEEVTKTVLFTGAAGGKWSVDLMLLMYPKVAAMIDAIAMRSGVKDYKFSHGNIQQDEFITQYAQFLAEPTEEQEEVQEEIATEGLLA